MKKAAVLILALLCALSLLCSCKKTADKTIAQDGIQSGETQTAKTENAAPEYTDIDVDLSEMSGTVAYSQVYDMMYRPSDYEGKIVKMRGPFSAFYSDETKLYYPAVIIRDATACCAQGIEFVLYGDPVYPTGYPQPNSEVTVVGTFCTYYEGADRFCHLINAIIL